MTSGGYEKTLENNATIVVLYNFTWRLSADQSSNVRDRSVLRTHVFRSIDQQMALQELDYDAIINSPGNEMETAAFELVPVGENPLRFKEVGGDVSAMMRLYTPSEERSSDVLDPKKRSSASCDMRTNEEMVIDNHRRAIKRKR